MKRFIIASCMLVATTTVAVAESCRPLAREAHGHGCHAMQFVDLPAGAAEQLMAAGHCDIPFSPTGGSVRTTEIVEVFARGVADGSVHGSDALTSMGIADTDGAHIMRVRLSSPGSVTLERVGTGTVFSGALGAGDTLVAVPSGGTYRLTTPSRTQVKATGTQPFRDWTSETVTIPDSEEIGTSAVAPQCVVWR